LVAVARVFHSGSVAEPRAADMVVNTRTAAQTYKTYIAAMMA
jgi:hypothetical protein